VFAPARISVLKLLASQAAISLENTRLYRDLAQREAKIRRLVDANIVGIFIWDVEGQIVEANDAFLRIVGYDREDLASSRLRWTDLTPPEWLDRDEQRWIPELKMTGSLQPFEKVYFRKDGSRVPVLIGVAAFDKECNQGVAFVLDLTERKVAEEMLRTIQGELVHIARVAILGEMMASIAHEINQPLAAVVNNASACLRWLAANNVEEARHSAELIIADGRRAGEIIGRIRALAKKAPPQKDWFDINEAIQEVIALTYSEVQENHVSLRTQLSGDLPLILGDRIQLQQVILNLMMNAIEAMSAVGEDSRRLWVSSKRVESGDVLIEVRDSGPGIDPKSLDHLFDAFYTTKSQGLGMGLAISRSIVEAHGGRLWATANVLHGAVFQFTLPIGSERVP
jgi:PAS domain S-box-containing protein